MGARSVSAAEHLGGFPRGALIPDELYCDIAGLPAVWLAEHFNVPLEQIQEKREDLRALVLF